MTAQRATWQPALNPTQRAYVAAVFLFVVGGVAFVGFGLPLTFPREEAGFAAALTAVMAAQGVWRVDSRLVFRTSIETMIFVTATFGFFFLSPAWFAAANALGIFLGGWLAPDLTIRTVRISAGCQFLGVVLVCAVTQQVGAEAPTDGFRALVSVALLWLVVHFAKFVGQISANLALRYRLMIKDAWTATGKGIARRLVPVTIGYLMAVAVASSPWMVVGVSVATMWMYYVFLAIHRSAAFEREIAWLADFGREAGRCTTVEELETVLAGAFGRFGFTTHAMAYPDPAEPFGDPCAGLRWEGFVTEQIVNGYGSIREISEIPEGAPQLTSQGNEHIWVWLVDQQRGSYLVLANPKSGSAARQITATGAYLVEIARVAVATIRRREQARTEADLAYGRRRTDPTTGLPNALALSEHLQEASRSGRSVGVVNAALVAIDHTVGVLGWRAGEELMRDFARRLETLLASSVPPVMLGRPEGNALCIISETDPTETLKLGFKIADDGSGRVPGGDKNASWSMLREVNVGVATSTSACNETGDDLFRQAQLALARSRASGHVEVVGDQELEREARQMAIRMRLPMAIERGEVVPAIQPQVDLASGLVVGGEVLARWRDPVLGEVSPAEFIVIAEQSQQIELLTISLFDQVLSSSALGGRDSLVPLAFNLSARSLANAMFLEALVEVADRNELAVADIRFEVAEASIAEDPHTANEGLGLLRSLGARIAIDNFGTGKSALALLDQLAADEVKISGELVSRIGTVEDPNPMVKNLLLLCADLELAVVAAGIEEHANREVLQGLGCRTGQGYLFAPPVSLAEFADLSESPSMSSKGVGSNR